MIIGCYDYSVNILWDFPKSYVRGFFIAGSILISNI